MTTKLYIKPGIWFHRIRYKQFNSSQLYIPNSSIYNNRHLRLNTTNSVHNFIQITRFQPISFKRFNQTVPKPITTHEIETDLTSDTTNPHSNSNKTQKLKPNNNTNKINNNNYNKNPVHIFNNIQLGVSKRKNQNIKTSCKFAENISKHVNKPSNWYDLLNDNDYNEQDNLNRLQELSNTLENLGANNISLSTNDNCSDENEYVLVNKQKLDKSTTFKIFPTFETCYKYNIIRYGLDKNLPLKPIISPSKDKFNELISKIKNFNSSAYTKDTDYFVNGLSNSEIKILYNSYTKFLFNELNNENINFHSGKSCLLGNRKYPNNNSTKNNEIENIELNFDELHYKKKLLYNSFKKNLNKFKFNENIKKINNKNIGSNFKKNDFIFLIDSFLQLDNKKEIRINLLDKQDLIKFLRILNDFDYYLIKDNKLLINKLISIYKDLIFNNIITFSNLYLTKYLKLLLMKNENKFHSNNDDIQTAIIDNILKQFNFYSISMFNLLLKKFYNNDLIFNHLLFKLNDLNLIPNRETYSIILNKFSLPSIVNNSNLTKFLNIVEIIINFKKLPFDQYLIFSLFNGLNNFKLYSISKKLFRKILIINNLKNESKNDYFIKFRDEKRLYYKKLMILDNILSDSNYKSPLKNELLIYKINLNSIYIDSFLKYLNSNQNSNFRFNETVEFLEIILKLKLKFLNSISFNLIDLIIKDFSNWLEFFNYDFKNFLKILNLIINNKYDNEKLLNSIKSKDKFLLNYYNYHINDLILKEKINELLLTLKNYNFEKLDNNKSNIKLIDDFKLNIVDNNLS